MPAASFAGVFVSVNIAPPVLPVYTQPLCPGEGYMWTPGYWAWGPEGYYWVPGVWVQPPTVGVLWTPGYWGWGNGVYLFHAGYWGPHVGFYGGVNYGFGYGGVGYEGGYWNHGVFAYNRSVNNINIVNIHNVYNKTVIVNNNYSRVSFNGGTGGIRAQESVQERAAFREQHFQATANQQSHEQMARQDRGQLASVNNGRPQMMAARTPEAYHSAAQQHAANFNNNRGIAPQARPQAQNYAQQSHPQPEQNHSQPQNHEQPHAQPQEHQGGAEHSHPEGHEGKDGR
jgi:WXXGXW repeat (2 copies)